MLADNVSGLMSTYAGERASNLSAALESIYSMSEPPGQMVIVMDGPVPEDQHQVLKAFLADFRVRETVLVQLDRQHGLAEALNRGLARCTGEWVMRMDSDDLCAPDRLREQLALFQARPDLCLVGSFAQEFLDVAGYPPIALKASPTEHGAILRALKWRNVLCHPSILVRRAALLAVGGYRSDFGKVEDYDLFVRLALTGGRFAVVPKPLVRVRVSMNQRRRRGGLGYLAKELRFRAQCRRSGFLTWPEFLLSAAAYGVFRLVPAQIRDVLYRAVRTNAQAKNEGIACPTN